MCNMTIFTPGMQATVSYSTIETPFLCVVSRIEGTHLLVLVTKQPEHITPGIPFVLTFIKEKKAHIVHGNLAEVQSNSILLNVLDEKNYDEKRAIKRYKINLSSKVSSSSLTGITATVKDISFSGCCLTSETELETGTILNISVQPQSSELVEFKGRIVRRHHLEKIAWIYGIKITSINARNLEKLEDLFDTLDSEAVMERKALELIYTNNDEFEAL
ncbi:MAG: PilZ domain-containing protein [Clostridia bacterium]|nr:PilZ domain-containing protein [Clostridia bacterium]